MTNVTFTAPPWSLLLPDVRLVDAKALDRVRRQGVRQPIRVRLRAVTRSHADCTMTYHLYEVLEADVPIVEAIIELYDSGDRCWDAEHHQFSFGDILYKQIECIEC